ncbi:MAG: molybdenum cofactor guanylyltransferase [Desulforhopalus sp.]
MTDKASRLSTNGKGVSSIFSRIPVFQISGMTKELRSKFIGRLLNCLQNRAIDGVYLKKEDFLNEYALLSWVKLYDIVIVDTGVDLPLQEIRMESYAKSVPAEFIWTGDNCNDSALECFTGQLMEELDERVSRIPIWACILIGGKSSRMGQPKHLIKDEQNLTWLERTTNILRPLVDGVVVSGAGLLPGKLADIERLADIPNVAGPLTGILAAMRWQPLVTWMFVACDMPHITPEAIHWLISKRRSGCWGRAPRLAGNKHCEPLLAWYDFRAAQLFEEQNYSGNLRIGGVASHLKIDNPLIPEALAYGWQNINTPEQLKTSRR